MHYIVDGYNLLFRLVKAPRPLQRTRERFLKTLDDEVAEAQINVIIIFDSAEKKLAGVSRRHLEAVEVIFTSEGLSADEYILEKICNSKQPKQQTVVSADRELLRKAKQLGAAPMNFADFFALLLKRKARHQNRDLQRAFADSSTNIARLLEIFENREVTDL